jgi:hypothetical protein
MGETIVNFINKCKRKNYNIQYFLDRNTSKVQNLHFPDPRPWWQAIYSRLESPGPAGTIATTVLTLRKRPESS